MSTDDARLVEARARAMFARARLRNSLGAVQTRLEPARLANDAWSGLRDRSVKAADESLAFAREKPAITSVAVGAGVLLVLRKPLARFLKRTFSRRDAADTDIPVTNELDREIA